MDVQESPVGFSFLLLRITIKLWREMRKRGWLR
jgi:hypothetical protein